MKLDNHEEYIKKSLQSHQPDVDIDALWSQLEPELHPKKKRRRGLIFWWLGCAFGIVVIAAYFHLYGPINKSAARPHHHAPTATNTLKTTTTKENKSNNNDDQTQLVGEQSSDIIAEKAHTSEVEQIVHSSSAATVVNEQQTVAATMNIPHKSTTKTNQAINTPSRNSHKKIDKDNSINSHTTNSLAASHDATLTIIRAKSNDNTFPLTARNSEVAKLNKAKTPPVQFEKDLELFNPLLVLEIAQLERESSLAFTPPILRPKKPNSPWSIYASGGWGSFKQTFTSEDKEYESFVSSINSPVSSQHVELGISRQYKGKWRLSLGILYGRLVQRSTLNDVIVIDTLVAGITETYYMRSGETSTVTGYLPAQRRIKNNIRWHSYEQQINLPLSIGYEIVARRWAITPQVGIQYELHTINNGAYINANQKLVTYNNQEINIHTKSQHRLTPHVKLEGSYALSDRQRLYMSSTFVDKKTRTLQLDHRVKETRKSFYFSLGTSYSF